MTLTYLITASSGIGAETARMLTRNAANAFPPQLYLVARDETKCLTFVEELRSLGAVVKYRTGDLTDLNFAPEIVSDCVSSFGRLDALFNVAGISGRRYGDGPVHECTEEGWAVTLSTNLTTQYRMCREVVRVMLAQSLASNGQRGAILNMTSILGIDPEPLHFNTVAYAASKGAIIAMSRAMAGAYAKDKIRVNAIAPALVRTPMSRRASEDHAILEFMKIKQPLLENLIPAEQVATACVFLLTDLSLAITGQVLSVDAGWSLA